MASNSKFIATACDFYIKHAGLIGALYCAIASVGWFFSGLMFFPLRRVYLLRFGLSLVIGCPIGAYINRFGADIWLAKHQGPSGPATILDGALIGAGVGLGISLLPALTSLIASSDINTATEFIIITYLSATVLGGIIGSVLAGVGRKYIDCHPMNREDIRAPEGD